MALFSKLLKRHLYFNCNLYSRDFCLLDIKIFFSFSTELQRKRRWQGGSVHDDNGHCPGYIPTMRPREENPKELTGEVRRTGCLHEHGVSRRDPGQDEERSDLGPAAVS